ncbi:hypothetical protein PBT90_12620 [Algoriphagus halophytocola]|uniref:Auto-transporter adhesin head GIN domain-containing protein n=1 Tax=Algoriphagus halophytocola TaxID=2991499 RepID=A0ABY6ML27_9BACT|nr:MULTISPECIES: hypothetical protein [unclassified Algoriphagus]UZD24229.1 hypothetical protein OM944_06945 [Algoriphagus sp. TR-M5]WBL41598.1 hypothetical protein PBT90_12620 [Algoriphagus sp. TR-M9]
MKTSNKYIFSFLSFSWLSIISTMLISYEFMDDEPKIVKTENALADFSAINIDEVSTLQIVPGDSNRLEYNELIGDGIEQPKTKPTHDLTVKNDTLYIRNIRNARNGNYTLLVGNLKHLIVSNTGNVNLLGFSQDSLLINSENSTVNISESSEFSFLQLKSEPKFDLTLKSVKDLSMLLTDDKCNVLGEVEEISGTIGNYAELSISRKTEKVDIDTSNNGKIFYVEK